MSRQILLRHFLDTKVDSIVLNLFQLFYLTSPHPYPAWEGPLVSIYIYICSIYITSTSVTTSASVTHWLAGRRQPFTRVTKANWNNILAPRSAGLSLSPSRRRDVLFRQIGRWRKADGNHSKASSNIWIFMDKLKK